MPDPKEKDSRAIFSWIVYIINAAACVLNLHRYASTHDPFVLAVAAVNGFVALAFLKGIPNVK